MNGGAVAQALGQQLNMNDATTGATARNEPSPTPARRTQGLTAYSSSSSCDKPAPAIDLALDANEGTAPANFASLLRGIGPETLRRYPSVRSLEETFAARWGVERERVIVTAGADDALERICRAWLNPGRAAILTRPTFSMLWRYVAMNEGALVEVPWLGGAFPTREVLASARASDPAIVFVVSPNNPTGNVASWEDVRAISDAMAGSVVVLDQAYAEFAEEDLTARALELPNVIVTRTLSKAYGLAGLRVGYAIGPRALVEPLRVVGHPYPVSGLSAAVAMSVLADDGRARDEAIERVKRERSCLESLLAERGAACVPSQANFVFARFGPRAEAIRRGLAERGIGVRGFGEDRVIAEYLRITCPGDEAAFGRLLEGLAMAMSEVSKQ